MAPEVAEQNGDITSYNIHISSALEQARHVNTNVTVFAVTGLRAYTNYSFVVQAVNSEGVGPNSSTIVNRTFEAGKMLVPHKTSNQRLGSVFNDRAPMLSLLC